MSSLVAMRWMALSLFGLALSCQSATNCDSLCTAAVRVRGAASLTVGGAACVGVTPSCTEQGPSGCAVFWVQPKAEGDCVFTMQGARGEKRDVRRFHFFAGDCGGLCAVNDAGSPSAESEITY